MNKKSKTMLSIILVSFFVIPLNNGFVKAETINSYPYQPNDSVIVDAIDYLKSQQASDGGIGGIFVSSWVGMALAAADENLEDWEKFIDYLEEKTSLLDSEKATDWERHLLAIIACNQNPRDFAGIDFVEKIQSYYDGNQIASNNDLFDDIFGVLALVSAGVDTNSEIIQNICNYILSQEKETGGWGELDATAIAVVALISAGKNPSSDYIQNALSYLKSQQDDSGGFSYWGNINSASTSWVIGAIVAAGENPTSNEWEKNGNNPIDYLIGLQNEDGSFKYTIDQNMNQIWMTAYAIPALLGKTYPIKTYEHYTNNAPNTPSIPSGPSSIKTGEVYSYSTSAIDTDGDHLSYRFDWDASGAHDYSSWTSFKNSGQTCSLSNKWIEPGTYEIKVQAKDVFGQISSWSEPLSINIQKKNVETKKEWSGTVRIEGKENTIYKGTVKFSDTYVPAENIETGEKKDHYIAYPSTIGAIHEVAFTSGIDYEAEYIESKDSLSIKTIDGESGCWCCWIKQKDSLIPVELSELTNLDNEVIWGYLDSQNPHILKIDFDKTEIKRNEEFTITVTDESGNLVRDTTVYVGSQLFETDENGQVKLSHEKDEILEIYAEKTGYVRSDKYNIQINKNVLLTKPISNHFYFLNVKLESVFKKIFVIGPIDITVDSSENIEKIEFFINEKLVFSDNESPFIYRLNEKSFFKKNKITVKSYYLKTVNNTELHKKIIQIIEKIKCIFEHNNIIKNIEFPDILFKHSEKTILVPGDTDTIEMININIFAKLHN